MGVPRMLCLTVLLGILAGKHAQECTGGDDDHFVFDKVFTIMYNGPIIVHGTESNMKATMGNCTTGIADKMVRYLEAYGVNLDEVKDSPFQNYDGNDYGLFIADSKSQTVPTILYGGTMDGYSKFINEEVFFAHWTFISKISTSGSSGSLQSGDTLVFGIFRLRMDGQNYCVQYNSKAAFHESAFSSEITPFVNECESEDWGKGLVTGLATLSDTKANYQFTMTFPAGPPAQ